MIETDNKLIQSRGTYRGSLLPGAWGGNAEMRDNHRDSDRQRQTETETETDTRAENKLVQR